MRGSPPTVAGAVPFSQKAAFWIPCYFLSETGSTWLAEVRFIGKGLWHQGNSGSWRNQIMIMVSRLKGGRHVVTRHDRRPETFFLALVLAAIVLV